MSIKPITVSLPYNTPDGKERTYRLRGNIPLNFLTVTSVSPDGAIQATVSRTANLDEIVTTLCSVVGNSNFEVMLHTTRVLKCRMKSIQVMHKGMPVIVDKCNYLHPDDIKSNWRMLMEDAIIA